MKNNEIEEVINSLIKKIDIYYNFSPISVVEDLFYIFRQSCYRKKENVMDYLSLFLDEKEIRKANSDYEFSRYKNYFNSSFYTTITSLTNTKEETRELLDEALDFIKKNKNKKEPIYSLFIKYMILKFKEQLHFEIQTEGFYEREKKGYIFLKFKDMIVGFIELKTQYQFYDFKGSSLDFELSVLSGVQSIKLGSMLLERLFKMYDDELCFEFPNGIIGTTVLVDNYEAIHLYKKYNASFYLGRNNVDVSEFIDHTRYDWGYVHFSPTNISRNSERNTNPPSIEEYNKRENNPKFNITKK